MNINEHNNTFLCRIAYRYLLYTSTTNKLWVLDKKYGDRKHFLPLTMSNIWLIVRMNEKRPWTKVLHNYFQPINFFNTFIFA